MTPLPAPSMPDRLRAPRRKEEPMSEPDEAAVEAVGWSVAGEPGTYANPVHLLWPDDQDPDLPHRFTESHFAEAWPNTEDSIVAPAFAALVQAVRDAERLRSSPSDPPLMQVDHAHPVPSSPDMATWLEGWCDHELGPIHGADCCAWREAAQAVRLLEADADARSDKALRHDLAATFGSRLNREQTFTGAQVAAMLRGDGA